MTGKGIMGMTGKGMIIKGMVKKGMVKEGMIGKGMVIKGMIIKREWKGVEKGAEKRAEKRAEVWVSAVLYVLIVVSVVVIVLNVGIPFIDSLRERSAVTKARDTLSALDQHIEDIAAEGQGSQRVVPIEVGEGTLRVVDNKLQWEIETKSKIIEPGSKIDLGNLVISSDVDVSAKEVGNFFVLQNSIISANFSKLGSETNFTSSILNSLTFKDNSAKTNGTFVFRVAGNSSTETGTGYTRLKEAGEGLVSGAVLAHVNSTAYEYELEFTLGSKADFIKTELKNVRAK